MTKKNENISEYIIQLYRQEDLVRAFDFDLEKIGTHVINHLPVSNIEKLSQVNFYEDLIAKMKDQKIEKGGHLAEANALVKSLEKISKELLIADSEYSEIYKNTKPAIDKNIALSGDTITSDIQVCLNAIYGFLLLKLNGKTLDENNQNKVEKFGDLLSYLSARYRQISESN